VRNTAAGGALAFDLHQRGTAMMQYFILRQRH